VSETSRGSALLTLAARALSDRLVYGAIVILAVLLALDGTGTTSASEVVGGVVVATMAVAFAELYSELVGETIRERRPLLRREIVATAARLGAILLAPVPPLLLVAASAAGLMSLRAAVTVAVWALVAVLFAFGFAAARASGRSVLRSAVGAALLVLVGLLMVGVKALATH
jgi:hypothetical protein